MLLVFDDHELAAAARASLQQSCPDARLFVTSSLARAAEVMASEPLTVALGALRLVDGRLTDLVSVNVEVPLVVLVEPGDEAAGVEAVSAGALDWATLTDATLQTLPELALGAAREWREFGLRRAAEAQLRHADRLALVGRVAAGVLHEIGTPLNVVRMRAQLLALDPSEMEEATQTIIAQADRMSGLIQSMLALSRRGDAARQPVDLLTLATSAQKLLRPTAKTGQVTIEVRGDSVLVNADPNQLLQVVLNLLTNAIDATGPGGGAVHLISSQDGAMARLAVADGGAGIAPEHLPHIFAPFFTTKDPGRGTGLGLSVSAQIAKDHGGRITARSRHGEGATFTLELPACGPSRVPQA